MANLIESFSSAANALSVFQRALSVTQNNVDNVSTPGFVAQHVRLAAQPFDVASGLAGGVALAGLRDSRDRYAEEAVQRQAQLLGQYTAAGQSTSALQNHFDISGDGGVAGGLNQLFRSFSAWSAVPGDLTARQSVISAATGVAASIRGMARSLSRTSGELDGKIASTVETINGIAEQIRQYNTQKLHQVSPDPGAET